MTLWHRSTTVTATATGADDDEASVSTAYSHAHNPGGSSRRRRRFQQQRNRSRGLLFMVITSIVFMVGEKRYQNMKKLGSPNPSLVVSSSHQSIATALVTANSHPKSRRERFPSMQQRVRLYMSIWYQPSDCNKLSSKSRIKRTTDEGYAKLEVKSSGKVFSGGLADLNEPLWLTPDLVRDCAQSSPFRSQIYRYIPPFHANRIPHREETLGYCRDVQEDSNLLFEDDTPILVQFGDAPIDTSDAVPMFGRWRDAASALPTVQEDIGACRIQSLTASASQMEVFPPILWPLGGDYGGSLLSNSIIKARKVDTPWDKKINKGVWRGIRKRSVKAPTMVNGPHDDNQTSPLCPLDDLECEFVVQHSDSDVIDAGYYYGAEVGPGGVRAERNHEAEDLVFKTKLSVQQLQEHKVMFVLDAHQNSADLLWSLSSSSVVIMPPPTHTSWVMEEMLVPWTHYIPLTANNSITAATATNPKNGTSTVATDLMQWIVTHDEEARKIAERASLYIYDLFFHPDAARDDDFVKTEILRRYRQYWA